MGRSLPWSTVAPPCSDTVDSMHLPFRVRRARPAPPEPAGLPAVRAERVLLSLAVHAQQNDVRLTRIERRLDELADVIRLEVPTHEDLSAVRIHSARVAAEVARVGAELARVTVDLQGRIDRLVMQTPVAAVESKGHERARMLATTIIDLSDALDTTPVDLRNADDDWAVTV